MKNKSIISKGVFFCTLPSLIGMAVFWFVPFIISFKYSVTDSMGSFAGFDNYLNLLKSRTFRLASLNTAVFTLSTLVLEFVIGTALAIGIRNLKRGKGLVLAALMLPMAFPSVSISFFWKLLFDENGYIRLLLFRAGHPEVDITNGAITMVIAIIIFLWKYTGFATSIMYSGLIQIPKSYYEVADIEGAGKLRQLFSVTLIYLRPSIVLTAIITFINSFKIYREIYLLYGSYPSSSVYTLQNYMNNLFDAGNIMSLSASAWLILAVLIGPIIVTLYLQNKFSKDFF